MRLRELLHEIKAVCTLYEFCMFRLGTFNLDFISKNDNLFPRKCQIVDFQGSISKIEQDINNSNRDYSEEDPVRYFES